MPNRKRKRQNPPKGERSSVTEEENRSQRRSTRQRGNLSHGIGSTQSASNDSNPGKVQTNTQVGGQHMIETPTTSNSNSTVVFDRDDLTLPILPGPALTGGPPSCPPLDGSIHSADGDNTSISTSSITVDAHSLQPRTEHIRMDKPCSSLNEGTNVPTSSRWIIFLMTIILASILYVGAYSLNQVHQIRVNLLKKAFQREMNRTQTELDALQVNQESFIATISNCKNEFQTLTQKDILCQEALKLSHGRVEAVENENAMLNDNLNTLEERISSLIGSKEDIHASLKEAWRVGDELKTHLEKAITSHESCETSLSSLTRVHFNVEEQMAKSSERILDLEKSSMQLDEEVEKLLNSIESDREERSLLEGNLMEKKNTIKALDKQLFRRNDNILAYEMQLRFLEENEEEHQEIIMDLQNWNQRLREQNEELKMSMYSQHIEALAALDAVASSATKRKIKQFEEFKIAVQAEKDQIAFEAASALNLIAAASNKMYKKELV